MALRGGLSAALEAGSNDLKSAVSFSNDFPFPCLLNPEDEPAEAPAASVAQVEADQDDDVVEEEDDDDPFELDEFVVDHLETLRLSSKVAVEAVGEDGQPLVSSSSTCGRAVRTTLQAIAPVAHGAAPACMVLCLLV